MNQTQKNDPAEPSSEFTRGAEEAIEALLLYFKDENQNSFLTDFSTTQIDEFGKDALRDVLDVEKSDLKRKFPRIQAS